MKPFKKSKLINLSDQTVMVLGASHGSGRQVVFEMLGLPRENRPKLLILVDNVGLEEFENNQKFLTVQVECHHIDLGSHTECRDMIRNCTNIDIVIYNGGVARKKLFEEMNYEQFMLTMEVNFSSNVCIAKEVLNYHNCVHMVFIGSTLSYLSTAMASEYCASKAALRAFVESLQIELENSHRGINISMVCPHFTSLENGNSKQLQKISTAVLKCMHYPELKTIMVGAQANMLYFLEVLIGSGNVAKL